METSQQTSDADASGSGPRVCDAPENGAAEKANAKANLWERIDPSEIEWSGYGIADYDLLDADRNSFCSWRSLTRASTTTLFSRMHSSAALRNAILPLRPLCSIGLRLTRRLFAARCCETMRRKEGGRLAFVRFSTESTADAG